MFRNIFPSNFVSPLTSGLLTASLWKINPQAYLLTEADKGRTSSLPRATGPCIGAGRCHSTRCHKRANRSLTLGEVYSPTGVLHEIKKSVIFLQSMPAAYMLKDLGYYTLWWQGDILKSTRTITEHLNAFRDFLRFCRKYIIRLHSGKRSLYETQVH